MKKATFLLVMGIIMIIFGGIAIFGSFGSIGGMALLSALGAPVGLLWISVILALLGAVAELIAGIFGCTCYKNPAKAGKCVTWGVIVIALAILSNILAIVAYPEFFNAFSIVTGLAVPVLYLVSAFMAKKSA